MAADAEGNTKGMAESDNQMKIRKLNHSGSIYVVDEWMQFSAGRRFVWRQPHDFLGWKETLKRRSEPVRDIQNGIRIWRLTPRAKRMSGLTEE